MFYQITLLNTGVPFCRKVSSFLISVAMETKGTIPTFLHFSGICSNLVTRFWLDIQHFEVNLL